jgi:anti-sigma factor RsiW
MRECENEDLHDALPGYAAGRLAGPERARVAEHIAGCAECAAEADLLRAAHQVMMQDSPQADVSRIVAALPAPPAAAARPMLVRTEEAAGSAHRGARPIGTRPVVKRPSRTVGYRPLWTGWRIAAAVSTIAVGGLSVALLRDLGGARGALVTVPPVVSAPAAGDGRAAHGGEPENIASADVGLAVGGGLSDLSEGEMEGLLKDLDGIEASPSDEPDAAAPGLHVAVAQ